MKENITVGGPSQHLCVAQLHEGPNMLNAVGVQVPQRVFQLNFYKVYFFKTCNKSCRRQTVFLNFLINVFM